MAQATRKPTKAHLSRAAKDMHNPNKKVREEAEKPPRLWLHHHGEQNRQAGLSRFGSENQNFPPL
jgi:hypothetical protein